MTLLSTELATAICDLDTKQYTTPHLDFLVSTLQQTTNRPITSEFKTCTFIKT
jgi:hypothetical protein